MDNALRVSVKGMETLQERVEGEEMEGTVCYKDGEKNSFRVMPCRFHNSDVISQAYLL